LEDIMTLDRFRTTRWWFAVLLAAAVGSCDSGTEPADDPFAGLEPGIHPVLVVARQRGGSATVELRFREVDVEARVSGFQGELTFDPQALALETASMPSRITGAWNEVEHGRLRFVGVALDGVGDDAVLSMTFRTSAPVTAQTFGLRMEEVIATTAPENVTSKVISRERPLFSRGPLR
jgi:hypothetical protein